MNDERNRDRPSPITPILLAGGTGTRLWPLSRDAMPKQFLPLVGERSSYQEALLRVAHAGFAEPIVLTGPKFQVFAQRGAQEVGVNAAIVIEPVRRDSGPAIAAAALIATDRDPNAIVLALAADHIIPDSAKFRDACHAGRAAAEKGYIVTFGVTPTEPKTSYGYILPGEQIDAFGVHKVTSFVEKPDTPTAQRYLRDGYLWNSGNFLFRADVMLAELARLEPEIVRAVERSFRAASKDGESLRLEPEAFARSPQKSIDYAVLEKTKHAAVVRGDFRWSDIGSWDALYDIVPHDTAGNVVKGQAIVRDTKDSIIYAGERLTAVVGVDNLVVVSTPDAVMVVPRAKSQDVRHLVDHLKSEQRPEVSRHRRIPSAWGYYESLDAGENFQVTRIVIVPGGIISRQMNRNRSGHWIVVRGVAEITHGGASDTVKQAESISIPSGSHQLTNRGDSPLELIEIQMGSSAGGQDLDERSGSSTP